VTINMDNYCVLAMSRSPLHVLGRRGDFGDLSPSQRLNYPAQGPLPQGLLPLARAQNMGTDGPLHHAPLKEQA
jgi:hypothetical protein